MAMLPFCGYHMGDYFAHWLNIGKQSEPANLPRIYYVNWFRQDENGKFLWPGYGENSRVLKWIFERCDGTARAVDTPIGRLPGLADLDTQGLSLSQASLEKLLNVDKEGWRAEVPLINNHFEKFGSRLPDGLRQEVIELQSRLK
jgi:phosphoenolpyruvate carboxykinase (GTP)